MDGWTLAWLLLMVAFLAVEVPGVWHRGATFSEHVWGRWFPAKWQRGVFLFFWSGVLGVHFWDAGAHWWSSGGMVAVAACGPLAIILKREGAMFGKIGAFFGKVGGWLKGGTSFVLSHGPWISSALVGLTMVFPSAGGVISLVAGLLNGGQVPPASDVGKVVAEFVTSLLLTVGSARKMIALAKASGGK